MMGKRTFSITIFLLIIRFSLHAQETDSIYSYQETDSLSIDQDQYKTQKILKLVVPLAMLTYGAISTGNYKLRKLDYSIRNKLLDKNEMWYIKWDNYLQFSPAVAAFGMKLGGMKSTHKLSDMLILYTFSNALESGIVYSSKQISFRERPDGSSHHSFPSGHTATAFVAAEFLHQEYKNQSVWISVGGYSMATLVGMVRIYNNRHWFSDVIAGAGIGILSTKFVYWCYPYLHRLFYQKGKKNQSVIIPSYSNGNLGLTISWVF